MVPVEYYLFTFCKRTGNIRSVPLPLIRNTLRRLLTSTRVRVIRPTTIRFLRKGLVYPVSNLRGPRRLINLVRYRAYCVLRLVFWWHSNYGSVTVIYVFYSRLRLFFPRLRVSSEVRRGVTFIFVVVRIGAVSAAS